MAEAGPKQRLLQQACAVNKLVKWISHSLLSSLSPKPSSSTSALSHNASSPPISGARSPALLFSPHSKNHKKKSSNSDGCVAFLFIYPYFSLLRRSHSHAPRTLAKSVATLPAQLSAMLEKVVSAAYVAPSDPSGHIRRYCRAAPCHTVPWKTKFPAANTRTHTRGVK